MNIASSGAVGPATQAAPRFVADLRPAADASALSRDTDPAPVAAHGPSGALPRMAARPESEGVRAVERVLKPFGVAMLPSDSRPGAAGRGDGGAGGPPAAADPRDPVGADPAALSRALTRPLSGPAETGQPDPAHPGPGDGG